MVTQLAAVDVSSLDDIELENLVVATERLLNAVTALSAVALGEFHRRGAWASDGALSAAGWAAARTGAPTRALRARQRTGAGLRLLPTAAGPVREGRLSPQHLGALAWCARRHPDFAARDEAVLVEQAQSLDADTFGVAARNWEAHAAAVESPDPTTVDPPEPVDELHLSQTFDGRYQLSGNFSSESGELLRAALDAEVDRQLRAARDGDPSVPPLASQVRAGALVDLVGRAMRREPSDQSVPDRYRVAVVIQHGQDGELPLAACDSPAFRVVVDARREVLDVGRLTQQWPAGIRRAITHRDGACVFPGCDRPPSWCDIHHCRPWHEGGKTSVDNGALLCRRHHSFVHKRRWTMRIENRVPKVRRPDGTEYVIKRWDPAPNSLHHADAA